MRRQYPSCRARRVQVPVQGPGPGPGLVQAQAQGQRGGRGSSSRYQEQQDPRQHCTALHSIYRAVRVDGSRNDNIHGQILINLRRLGHQIKPAESWLPLLERMLIEGLHCPDTETLALAWHWPAICPPQILAAPNNGNGKREPTNYLYYFSRASLLPRLPPSDTGPISHGGQAARTHLIQAGRSPSPGSQS